MYLGLAFALVGWAMHLANLAALFLVPAFVAYMTRFQIKPEERALLAEVRAELRRLHGRCAQVDMSTA